VTSSRLNFTFTFPLYTYIWLRSKYRNFYQAVYMLFQRWPKTLDKEEDTIQK